MLQTAYGGPEVLRLADVPLPVPGHSQVRIRVHAVGLNAMDWRFMRARPPLVRLMFGLRRPRFGPGFDFAGTVEQVAYAHARFSRGDAVLGSARGALSEFVCAPTADLVRKPAALGFEEAACLPVAGMTALQALRDAAGVRPGDDVLVIGASGGVGSFAVQIARLLGGRVTGVCSTRNVDFVRGLGANRVIDYTTGSLEDEAQAFDAVLDVAGCPLATVRRLLKPTGVYVCAGHQRPRGGPLRNLLKVKMARHLLRERMVAFHARRNMDDLAWLAGQAAVGALLVPVTGRYGLDAFREAMRAIDSGHTRGKLVVNLVPEARTCLRAGHAPPR